MSEEAVNPQSGKGKHHKASHRAARPYFSTKWPSFTCTVPIPKYELKEGDTWTHRSMAVTRMYWNRRKIGPTGHPWTEYAISQFNAGKPIREFSVHPTFEEAVSARSQKKWNSTIVSVEEVAENGREAELNELTKKQLVKFALDEFGLELNLDDKKAELVAEIVQVEAILNKEAEEDSDNETN